MKEKTRRLPYTVLLPNNHYINIEESIKYDMRIIMENTERQPSTIGKFIEMIYKELSIKAKKIKTKCKKNALNNIICNLLIANKKNKIVAISRRPATYSNWSSYGLDYYTYRYIIGCADALLEKKYTNQWSGYYDKKIKKGKVTRMWGTSILLDEINKFYQPTIVPEMDNEERCEIIYLYGDKAKRIRFDNPIILKDKNKNILNYKMNQTTSRMKNFLCSYNSFIDKNNISVPEKIVISHSISTLDAEYQSVTKPGKGYIVSSTLPLLVNTEAKCNNYIELDCWLYRVFNNGRFEEGGRFYGAEYQSLNEKERAEILINNNTTREVDYKAYHLRMLYHLEGLDYKGDPYLDVTGIQELRTPVKKMVQMIINAKTEYEAIKAFEKYLNEVTEIKNIVYSNGLDGRELLRIITNTHKRIEKYFNTGIGVKLQFIDSKIAERILKHFTKKKIVCLCIHDSFIVEGQYLDELIEVMKREYKKENGFECELKVNG